MSNQSLTPKPPHDAVVSPLLDAINNLAAVNAAAKAEAERKAAESKRQAKSGTV